VKGLSVRTAILDDPARQETRVPGLPGRSLEEIGSEVSEGLDREVEYGGGIVDFALF
jgi:hypothetical protein